MAPACGPRLACRSVRGLGPVRRGKGVKARRGKEKGKKRNNGQAEGTLPARQRRHGHAKKKPLTSARHARFHQFQSRRGTASRDRHGSDVAAAGAGRLGEKIGLPAVSRRRARSTIVHLIPVERKYNKIGMLVRDSWRIDGARSAHPLDHARQDSPIRWQAQCPRCHRRDIELGTTSRPASGSCKYSKCR